MSHFFTITHLRDESSHPLSSSWETDEFDFNLVLQINRPYTVPYTHTYISIELVSVYEESHINFGFKVADDDDDDDFFNIEDGDFAELFFTKKSRGLPADAGLNRRTTAGRYVSIIS